MSHRNSRRQVHRNFIDYTSSIEILRLFLIYHETIGNFQATCDDDDAKAHVAIALETYKKRHPVTHKPFNIYIHVMTNENFI